MCRALAIGLCVMLCGCVAERMDDGLRELVDQNIEVAVARLGAPDGERVMPGRKVYAWSSFRNESLPLLTTSTVMGVTGREPLFATRTGKTFVPRNFDCLIEIVTDPNGTIASYQWSGNAGGCATYAHALTR